MKTNTFYGGDPNERFQGKSVLFKWVQQLSCETFSSFFESQLYSPIRLNLTRQEYHELEPEMQKRVKFVKYFTPGVFTAEDPDRPGFIRKQNEHVVGISLICLDIDPDKAKDPVTKKLVETGNYPAAPFVNDPSILNTALDGLNFAAYTTLNHTTQAPRIRILVEASGFDSSMYAQAVSWVAGKLGLEKVTTESKTISQAMFRPTVFKDTNMAKANPVFARCLDAHALTPGHFKGSKVIDSSGPRLPGSDPLEGLEFLRPRAADVTLEDVKEALVSISPDINMHDWIRIAMSLRHQFIEEDDEAFVLFDEWSSGGGTYEGTDKTRYRWDNTDPNTFSRLPVTIKTFFKLAKDSGWSNEEVQQRYFDGLVLWMNTCESAGVLIEQGINRIVTTPLVSPVLEEGLLKKMQQISKKHFSVELSITVLKKRLKQIRSDIRSKEREEEKNDKGIPAWAQGIVYVSKTKQVVRIETGEAVDRDSFDSTYADQLLPTDKDLEELGIPLTRQAKATPIIKPQDFVLNEIKVPKVYDDKYDPSNAEDSIITKNKIRYVNTYRKTYGKPVESKEAEQFKVFNDHLCLLIAEEDLRELILDFIAFMVQSPGIKIRWAVLIQSVKGNGKGLFSKMLRGVFGHGNVTNVDPQTIFGQYNDWAYGSQLVVMNEIRVTGHSRHEVMNKLKEPIADDQVSIFQRYRDHREVDNNANYIMFTNFHDAIAVDPDERRYLVIKSPLQTKQDIASVNERGLLKPMQNLVDEGDFSGLRYYFENREISPDFKPNGPPPTTNYLLEMCSNASSEIEMIFDELIEDSNNPLIQPDLLSSGALIQAVNMELTKMTNAKGIGNLLMSRNYIQVKRAYIDDERHRLYIQRGSPLEDLDLEKIIKGRMAKAISQDLTSEMLG